MSPYRVQANDSAERVLEEEERCPDADLLPAFALLWIGSVARVALGFVEARPFGSEAALATLTIVALPYLSRDTIAWSFRRASTALRSRRSERARYTAA
jgi:hypothetical protein